MQERSSRAGLLVLVFILSCAPVWALIAQRSSTPFDEAAHFDFVDKLSTGDVPQVNEKYGGRTLWMVTCLTPSSPAWAPLGDCQDPEDLDPNLAPFNGQSSATGYSPTYYIATAIMYRGLLEIDKLLDLPTNVLDIARIANSFWIGFSAGLILLTCLRLGMKKRDSVVTALAVGSSPALLLQFSTLNSDAGAHFASVAILCFGLNLWLNGFRLGRSSIKRHIWCLSVIVVLTTFKETSLLVLPGVLLLLTVPRTEVEGSTKSSGGRDLLRSRTILTGMSFLAVATLSLAFRVLQPVIRGRGGEDWQAILLPTLVKIDNVGFLFNDVLSHAFSPFSSVTWPEVTDPAGRLATILMNLLPFMFVFSALASKEGQGRKDDDRSRRTQTVSKSYLLNFLSLPVGSLCLGISSMASTGFVVSQPRYYMSACVGLILLGIWAVAKNLGGYWMMIIAIPWILTFFSVII